MLRRMSLPVASEWCRYRHPRIHLGSRSSCNGRHLAVGLGAISLPDKITANDAGPYIQDSEHELRRMGERRSSVGFLHDLEDLVWRQRFTWAMLTAFVPAVLASVLVIRYADLERRKHSRFGRYMRRYMDRRVVDAWRFFGQVLIWVGRSRQKLPGV